MKVRETLALFIVKTAETCRVIKVALNIEERRVTEENNIVTMYFIYE
ncbi:MAG: hypothetical protein M3156_05000 [Thermoproteota archaeon]|nr:hypothetical protein [Thermoproteota archaeon]